MIEMITDPDYINQKLLLLVQKIQQDQRDQSNPRFSVDGKSIILSERIANEKENNDTVTSPSKPPLGRFDSGDSETGLSSLTFQVSNYVTNQQTVYLSLKTIFQNCILHNSF